MSSNNITVPSGITTKFSIPAWLKKVNPFSMGSSGDQYVPEWFIKLFQSRAKDGSAYNNSGSPAKLAHVFDKTIHGAALLAGVALATRAAFHWAKVDNIDNMNPSATASGKLNSDKSTNIDPVIPHKKKKEQMNKTEALDPYHTSLAVIPTSAALLAALAAFVQADKHYDKKLGDKLDNDLYRQRSRSNALARQRIRAARGIQDQQTLDKQQSVMTKQAGIFPKKLQGYIALIAAALSLGGFAVGFDYQRNNSKSYAKYKANKKGLQELLRNRAYSGTVPSRPLDEDFIKEIDSNIDPNKKNIEQTSSIKELELV